MIKRLIRTLVALLFLSGSAFAQTQVYQSGTVTPGDPAVWTAQRYIGDGTLNGGFIGFTITNSLPAFNYYDAYQSTGNYHLLQIGANSTSNAALISYSATGSVSTQPLLFTINGGTISFNNSAITLGAASAVNGTLNVAGSGSATTTTLTQGQLILAGTTSGGATVKVIAAAGTPTIVLPSTNGTVAGQPWIWNSTSLAASYAAVSGASGSGETFLLLDGSPTNGFCSQFDSSGGLVAASGPCSATAVGAGTAGNIPYYAVTGSVIAANTNLNISAAALTVGVAGSSQGSLSLTGAGGGAFIQAVPSTISSYTITWPSAIPTSGQALTATNGSGALGWAIPPGVVCCTYENANFNAVANTGYAVDTSAGAVTATIEASPSTSDAYYFLDAKNTFATNNLTLARNGHTIMNQAANFAANITNFNFTLQWDSTDTNWIIR